MSTRGVALCFAAGCSGPTREGWSGLGAMPARRVGESGPSEMVTRIPTGGHNQIYVVLENVRSLFNVGAVFRTADGVGAAGIYLTGFTGCPPRKEIHRVALGAEETVDWAYVRNPVSAIECLQEQGVQVIALEQTDGSVDFREFSYRFPVAVVLGHEVEGVRPETVAACDGAVHIPMCGHKTSLNVSVAGGVILYDLLRRVERRGPKSAKV